MRLDEEFTWNVANITVDVYALENGVFSLMIGAQEDGEFPHRLVEIKGSIDHLEDLATIIRARVLASKERHKDE